MKLLPNSLLSACVALLAVAHAHAQATIYGIGDLPGGKTYSQVNDATKVGGVIYAVGGSTATHATNNNDRAVLWTSSSGGTLVSIPDFVNNTPGTGGVIATAITPDGAAIAGRLHADATLGVTSAALITTSGLTSINLGNLGSGLSSQAVGISDNGAVLYGSVPYNAGDTTKTQLVRYTNSAGSIAAVPFLSGTTNMFISSQAAISADGDKVVGIVNNGGGLSTAGTTAFVYSHTGTDLSADVPYLAGGTWNGGLAINSAGTLGLIGGNSTSYSLGQLYLYNDTTNIDLGSPNAGYSLLGGGGLNADGSVVTATFSVSGTPTGFVRNSAGWFSLSTMAAAAGADLTGWSALNIFGMSPDATLVWGNGLHNGNTEGFVLEFGSGVLTAIPEPSTYAMIVGLGALGLAAWRRKKRIG